MSAKHNMASFAFQLAKEKLGIGRAIYRKGQARSDMANQELFAKEFAAAKVRIRSMQVRYVEEKDPIRQAEDALLGARGNTYVWISDNPVGL